MNKFLVGASADGKAICVLNLPMEYRLADVLKEIGILAASSPTDVRAWPAPAPFTPDEALNLAAWLVAVTGRRADFLALLDAVQAT